MNENIAFLANVLCPGFAGVFFLFYALYFYQTPLGSAERRGAQFASYLLFFGLYLLTRPLQLLLGPHPWPMAVNCVRTFMLAGLCGPLVLCSALAISDSRQRLAKSIFAAGIALGLAYAAFNIVGTTGSVIVFRLGDIVAYDNCTPSMRRPLYAREATMVLQLIAGAGFPFAAAMLTIRAARMQKQRRHNRQLMVFGLGTLTFGAAMVIGTAFKSWWIYYVASVPCTVIMGYAVLADIRLLNIRIGRAMPFIREELFHVLCTGVEDSSRLHELMDLLGRSDLPDTCLVVELDLPGVGEGMLDAHDSADKALTKILNKSFKNRFLLLPIGPCRFAVLLPSQDASPARAAEQLQEAGHICTIGLGRSYPSSDIQRSYLEALNAIRFARGQGRPFASYQDVTDLSTPTRYPVAERDELLKDILNGNKPSAVRRLDLLLDRLAPFCDNNSQILANRLNDLLGLMVAAAVDAGADPVQAFELSDLTQKEARRLKTVEELESYFRNVVQALPMQPSQATDPAELATKKARAFIQAEFANDITLELTARRVGVSASHLQRLLRQNGAKFSALLTQARLSKARELLAAGSESITDIAFQIGFRDSNYFSTVFKKHEGVTPRQFRKGSRS